MHSARIFPAWRDKRSTVINAIGAGIRYIEGVSMRRAVAQPQFAIAQGLTDYCRMTS